MRWVKRISLGTLVTVLALLALASLMLETTWGARLVLGRASAFVPGELRMQRVEGTLAGPLRLLGIEYHYGGLSVTAGRLDVDVSLLDLSTGRLTIDELRTESLRVLLPASSSASSGTSEPLRLPELALPMRVSVKHSDFRGSSIVPHDGEPVAISRVQLQGGIAGGVVNVGHLSVEAPMGSVQLAGRVDTGANYQTRLDAKLAWQSAGRGFTGRLSAEGDLDRLETELDLASPADATLRATLTGLPAAPAFEFRLEARDVNPDAVWLAGMPGPISGRLMGSGDPGGARLSGWLAAGGERAEIENLAASWGDGALVLEELKLHGERAARLAATGRVSFGEHPAAELDADWSGLLVPLPGGRRIESGQGRVRVNGMPDDYSFDLDADVGGLVPDGHWQVTGSGSLDGLAFDSFRARTLGGSLQGGGRIAWRPAFEWRGRVEAKGVNPAGLAPEWPGNLSATLTSSGEMSAGAPGGELHLTGLDGTLRQRALSGQAELTFTGLERISGSIKARSGESSVSAQGKYGPDTDARVSLDVDSLGDWLPGAAGSLKGQVRLSGAPRALSAAGSLEGSALALSGASLQSLSTDFDLSLDPAANNRVRAQAAGLEAGPVSLETLSLDLDGGLADHRLALEARGPDLSASLKASGGWRQGQWQGSLEALRLDGPGLGGWRLQAPVAISGGPAAVSLDSLCLSSDRGRLCGQADWKRGRALTARADLDGLPLPVLDPLLRMAMNRPVSLAGQLDAHLELNGGPGEVPRVEGRWSTRDAAVSLPGAEGTTTLDLQPLQGRLSMGGGCLEASLDLGLDEAGRLKLELASADFQPGDWPSAPVKGNLEVDLGDLSPLSPLIPGLARPRGALKGELALSGSLGALNAGGELILSGFATEVPAAGIALADGRLTLNADGSRFRFDGEVSSGGRVAFSGTAGLADDGTPRLKATLKGEDFRAVDRPGLEADVSPDLTLALAGRRLELGGKVAVPKALVDTRKLEGGGVSPSPDVEVVGREASSKESAIQFFAELDVSLGDDITLKAPGFEGSANGSIHVSDQPGRPTLASGELGVTGSYEAYGQSLSIRSGRLLFSSTPVDNPGLDITAVRTEKEVTAGVRINGTARNPQATLFSEPALGSESEILSYLVLGRPLDQASSGEGATLSSAALSLGLKGGDALARQIGSRFGLSDVGVSQSSELGQSALTLGKYLSPRLYLSYGVGLVDPVSVVRLRYELSDHWALEAASGTETSGAITFYYEH